MTADGICPLCGHREFETVKEGVAHAPAAQVSRCRGCRLVFLLPRPTDAELADYYSREYRELYDTEDAVERRFRADRTDAERRVSMLRPAIAKGARVLEIGSGSGAFLSGMKPHAGAVEGVEPDERSRAWIKATLGLPVARSLDEVGQPAGGFDLIVMFHVLEHLPDPVGFLAGLKDRLAPGGKIAVEVPNVDDALVSTYAIPAFVERYYTAAHLYYFGPETLAAAIAKAGLTGDVHCVQRYDLSNHLRWLETGKPGGQGYYGNLLSAATAQSYADDLIRSGKADTLWVVCEKAG